MEALSGSFSWRGTERGPRRPHRLCDRLYVAKGGGRLRTRCSGGQPSTKAGELQGIRPTPELAAGLGNTGPAAGSQCPQVSSSKRNHFVPSPLWALVAQDSTRWPSAVHHLGDYPSLEGGIGWSKR